MTELPPLEDAVLPEGIRARFVEEVNGLRLHLLEAGFETPGRPLLLLLHGFPELAYSWRKIMLPLAEAGFHVVAPDQRGYGRTTGWDADYDGDLAIAERRHQSQRIAHRVQDAKRPQIGVVIGAPAGGAAIAALVGSNDVVTGLGQARHHLAPGIGQLGKAVQQQDQLPARGGETGLENVHPQPVDLVDKARADTGG